MAGKGQGGIARLAAAGLLLALLGGCINIGSSKAPGSLIRLTPAEGSAAGLSATAKAGEALVVFEPQTDRSLGVTRVPVQVNDSTLAYLAGANWVDRPARLMRALLAETIRGRGKRLVFEDDQGEVRGNLRLTGRLSAMGYDARSRSVVVRFDAMLQMADGAMASRRFEAVRAGVAPKAKSIAPALNAAANEVAGQVADWVK